MANLVYQPAQTLGTNLNLVAATAGGDRITPDDRGCLAFRNADTTSVVVTLVTPGNDKYGNARPDIAITVPVGATVLAGPLPGDLADPVDGRVVITYAKVTALTVGAFIL